MPHFVGRLNIWGANYEKDISDFGGGGRAFANHAVVVRNKQGAKTPPSDARRNCGAGEANRRLGRER